MKRKGTPKTGGRCKGTQNHISSELRGFIKNLLESNQEQIITDLQAIEPYQRLNILTGLFKYCVPALQKVDIKTDLEKTEEPQINIYFDSNKQKLSASIEARPPMSDNIG